MSLYWLGFLCFSLTFGESAVSTVELQELNIRDFRQ